MRIKVKYIIWFFLLCGTFTSCIQQDVQEPKKRLYDIFWNDVNTTYPFFQYDRVDWDSVMKATEPLVSANTTDTELFTIFSTMLSPLMDGHASLSGVVNGINRVWVNPKNLTSFPEFSLPIVLKNYLRQDTSRYRNKRIFTGIIRPGVLYYYLADFSKEGGANVLDSAIRSFGAVQPKAVIIDVRNNPGGLVVESERIAGILTSRTYNFGFERYKHGPRFDDFSELETRQIRPYLSFPYVGQVILLTNHYSASSSERLRLALKYRPFPTLTIGDTTFGATSPIITRKLPNGWEYVLVGSVTTDLDGKLYERIGIPPDVRAGSTIQDLQARRDRALEEALSRIP